MKNSKVMSALYFQNNTAVENFGFQRRMFCWGILQGCNVTLLSGVSPWVLQGPGTNQREDQSFESHLTDT